MFLLHLGHALLEDIEANGGFMLVHDQRGRQANGGFSAAEQQKTPFERHTKVAHIADRGASYRMDSVRADGNDAEQMWQVSREAIGKARAGGGPTLIEAVTFRFRGHSFGDDSSYIVPDQMSRALVDDSVPRLRAALLEAGHATEDELAELEKRVAVRIDEAVQFALDSPFPDEAEIRRDIYSTEVTV